MKTLGFSGSDLVEEIRNDSTVESMFRDFFLPTFTWGGYRRLGFQNELKHLKTNLSEEPQWNISVPVLYLYGGKDRWVNGEHIRCVLKKVRSDVVQKVVKFPQSKHLLPVKQSSLIINEFLWENVF